MFSKWTLKEVVNALIALVVYLLFTAGLYYLLILLVKQKVLPYGWASEAFIVWPAAVGGLSSLPLSYLVLKKGFGSTLIFPLIFLVIGITTGYVNMLLAWIIMGATMVIAEGLRFIIGYKNKWSARVAVPVASLVPFLSFVGYYFSYDTYILNDPLKNAIIESLGEAQANGYLSEMKFHSSIMLFAAVFVAIIVASAFGEYLMEVFTKKNQETK